MKSQDEADKVSKAIMEKIDSLSKRKQDALKRIVKVNFINYDAEGYIQR